MIQSPEYLDVAVDDCYEILTGDNPIKLELISSEQIVILIDKMVQYYTESEEYLKISKLKAVQSKYRSNGSKI